MRPLYPPGRVIHLIETTGGQWFPMWQENKKFDDIVISTSMMKHHLPNFVFERLLDIRSNYRRYNYHNISCDTSRHKQRDTSYTTDNLSDVANLFEDVNDAYYESYKDEKEIDSIGVNTNLNDDEDTDKDFITLS